MHGILKLPFIYATVVFNLPVSACVADLWLRIRWMASRPKDINELQDILRKVTAAWDLQ